MPSFDAIAIECRRGAFSRPTAPNRFDAAVSFSLCHRPGLFSIRRLVLSIRETDDIPSRFQTEKQNRVALWRGAMNRRRELLKIGKQ